MCSSTKIELRVPVPKILSVITIIVELDDETKHTQIEADHLCDLFFRTNYLLEKIRQELDEEDSKTNLPFCSPTEM